MKLLFVLSAGLMAAQSNPSWWKYTPPGSTSIVGIQWKELKMSVVAPVIAAEMTPGGTFGFPDMEILRSADQILVGSPSMVAVEYGTFPIAKLRAEATQAGLKRSLFGRAELYTPSDHSQKSVAYISEKLLLVGSLPDLQEAIDRIANPKDRSYSPLLGRAARYSKEDLWVVAEKLPDPLASLFVPIQAEASAFEGAVSFWDGLHLVAAIERASPTRAMELADSLVEDLAVRPGLAEATEITTRERSVLIRMDLDEMELISNLRVPAPAEPFSAEPHPPTAVAAAPAKAQPKAFVPPAAKSTLAAPVQTAAVSAVIPDAPVPESIQQGSPQVQLPPAPPQRKIVRIVGLETGPVEIPLGH